MDPTVQAALVTTLGAVLVAGIAGVVKVILGVRDLRSAVGTPNGHGDLVQMAEALLSGQAGQDRRLAKLETGQAEHAARIDQVEQTLSTLAD